MKKIRYIIYVLAAVLCTTACKQELLLAEGEIIPPPIIDNGIGQMVLFSSGTTENSVTRASANTYYMPDTYRFVCKMYYKAQAGVDTLDIHGGSDQTTWLKVKGSIGNSLYWNKEYAPVNEEVKGKGGVDDYGNDYNATAFYWQNRKEHAFLAWTDLNKATSIVGGENQGQLKFGKDEVYKIYTGATSEKWTIKRFEVNGIDQPFNSLDEIQNYMITTVGDDEELRTKLKVSPDENDWNASNLTYYYQHGLQCKYTDGYAKYTYDNAENDKATLREYGWTKYQMFFDKLPFNDGIPDDAEKVYDEDNPDIVKFLKDPTTHNYIAAAEVWQNSEGQYLDKDGNVTTSKDEYAYDYFLTDQEGNIKYNEENPKYVFYYKEISEKESTKVVEEYPVLAFDLTRGETTSMVGQPDIVQAVEIQAPNGATQESNRVNLYFKHQFSQVQVNVRNAADNSVTLDAGDIQSVELLGVTKKGYVFTELDKDGKIKSAAYEAIDFSKYSEEELKENQFGTSFKMYELSTGETATGYLKSFNAIAYGQLQAIRITWKEKDTNYVHAATFRIPSTDLMNLQSGVRYVWNIEIRRGTLAIIRTEIVDWELPTDDNHNGTADGIIKNNEE